MSTKRVVIVGGVAGGASCAARLRRQDEDAAIVMVERGPYISYANCGLPYHMGGVIESREALLVQTEEDFSRRFDVDVRSLTEAVSIDREKRTVRLVNLCTKEAVDEPYDFLVLSPGAEPARPPIPGVDSPGVMTLRSIPDLDAIIARLNDGRVGHAVVVGAGFIGLEVAENLRHRGIGVTLVEHFDRVMPLFDQEMAAPLATELAMHGVDVRLGVAVKSIEADESGTLTLTLGDEAASRIEAGIVLMATGVKPEVTLAKDAGLRIGETGAISIDDSLRTSDERIFAVGDAVEVTHRLTGRACRMPLAGPANRQGRLAADVIAGKEVTYRGPLGTSIVKVFRLTAGSTGLTEAQAAAAEVPHEVMWSHGASHAGYYPGATPFSLKAVFEPGTGRVLGAQAVGHDGVDKRLDVLATAITAGMTVFDLEELDLSYAPPFSSAKDPVNHLGTAAANMLRGEHPGIRADALGALSPRDLLVDVRTADEFECGTIPGALNIPLDELRERLGELSREQRVVVFCQVGIRGYLATRILAAHDYECANVLGGYRTWLAFNAASGDPAALDPVGWVGADDSLLGRSCSSDDLAERGTDPRGAGRASVSNIVNQRSGRDVGLAAGAGSAALAALGEEGELTPSVSVDACGLACPGPILKVKEAMDGLEVGGVLEVTATDPGFMVDLPAWARRTGGEVLDIAVKGSATRALVRKGGGEAERSLAIGSRGTTALAPSRNGQTIVVFSGELDKGLAALIIATGAASMAKPVTLFFTFWGLNLLRKSSPPKLRKGLMERMFSWMMPRGAERARLSKMNMGGAGTVMMKRVMHSKSVASLPQMLEVAREMNVRLVACQMSMDVMGMRIEELIDGVEVGGVAAYLDAVEDSHHNLFI